MDAVVEQPIPAGQDSTGRFGVPTCWQMKAEPTANMKPKKGKPKTQQAALREEINKPYAAALINKGYGYRLCIADDMPATTKARWESWLTDEAKKINPSASSALVVTASDLALWINRYPAQVLRFRPNLKSLKSFDVWSAEVRALTKIYGQTAQWSTVSTAIRSHVDFSRKIDASLVVQGEVGVGKTRITCEALAGNSAVEGLVVATSDEQMALSFAEDVARDSHVKAILVADECSLRYRERIRQLVPSCSDRLRVIAIDNSLKRAGMAGEIRLTRTTNDDVERILSENFPDLPADRRRSFAGLAEGFVRLGVELCQHDHLIPPDGAIHSVFAFFKDSYLVNRLSNDERASVELLSLLPRVGYRDDVADELRKLCGHPVINRDPQRVIEIANELKQSPGFIAFGGRYLYVTPKLISQVAFQSAWERWVESDPQRFLSELAPELIDSFVEQARNAQNPTPAAAISDFFFEWAATLRPPDLASEATVTRLTRLVETQPEQFLPLLQALVESVSTDELHRLHSETLQGQNARRQLVWLAEKLSHLTDKFYTAESLLLRLARAESEPHLGNSASQVWEGLYRIVLSGTPIPFLERLALLEKRLLEADATQLPLAVAAFEQILTDGPVMALAAPPVVLGRIPPPVWRPADGAERQACLRAGMEMAARIAANGGIVGNALRVAVEKHIYPLLLGGYFGEVQAVIGSAPIPDTLLASLGRSLEDFFDAFARDHVLNVQRRRPKADGGEETVTVQERRPRKVSPEFEARVREWYARLVPGTLHGRLVSVVGHEPWQRELGLDPAAWQRAIAELAVDFLRAPAELDRELPWLASSEARSSFQLGQALARIDTGGLLLDRMLLIFPREGATGIARGYLDQVVAANPKLLEEVNSILDRLQAEQPRIAFELLWSVGPPLRKVERIFKMIDAGAVPPEMLRSFGYDIQVGQLEEDHLFGALDRTMSAAEQGNAKAGVAAIRLLYSWLHRKPDISAAERLKHDDRLKASLHRLLVLTAEESSQDPTFWFILAEDLAPFEPKVVIGLVIRVLINRDYNTRRLAEELLVKLAADHPGQVLASLGDALLHPESNAWLHLVDVSDILCAIPEMLVRRWIEQNGVSGARAIASHLQPPHLSSEGKPVVPPLTSFILERFENDERVFQAFLSGAPSRGVYIGDIAAQHEGEERAARHFLRHPLRRVREWARVEIKFAHQQASIWRQRDEEDRLP